MSKALRVRFLSVAVCAILTLLIASVPEKVDATPIPRILLLQQINRIAGTAGTASFGGDSGLALAATVDQPQGVAVDGAGNLYIADTSNNRIRRVDAATGIITTVAGNGSQGYNGDGGLATSASLYLPAAVLVDAHGNLYIADTGNRIVRFINIRTGIITTVAGTPNLTTFDPTSIGDGGPATAAELDSPAALALDTAGNLYIADSLNNRIREVSAANGTISTVGGTGAASFTGDGGLATAATLNQPTGIGLDEANNLYIADSGNNRIREVTAGNGDINTVAGTGATTYNGDSPSPGTATSTNLNFPTGLAVDATGNVYFSDHASDRIRELNTGAGEVVTLAGTGTAGFTGDGGLASAAEVNLPVGLAVDEAGDLYVADAGSNDVRQISYGFHWPSAEVATATPVTHTIFIETTSSMTLTPPTIGLAENGKQEFTVGTVGGTGCTMDGSTTVTMGTVCQVPVSFNPAYPGERTGALQFTLSALGVSLPRSFGLYGIGLGPQVAIVPGTIRTVISPGIAAADGIPLTTPTNGVSDSAGNVYIADPGTNLVLRQDATTAALTIVAGGGSSTADGIAATDALLNHPTAVALDTTGGILYIAEAGANRIREVFLGSGTITTIAGNGTAGYTGDNGYAGNAQLNSPSGIAINATGDIFIADTGNKVIRRVSILTGTITTVAGTGTAGPSGDGGYALSAELNAPQGVAVDALGRLVIADTGNNRVRSVDPVTSVITTVAGNGSAAFSGDGSAAVSASLNQPTAVALDAADDIYIADSGNARIRKLYAASGNIATVAGSARVGDQGEGEAATAAALSQPTGVFLDPVGQIYIADQSNGSLRQVTVDTPILNFGSEIVGGTTPAQTDFLSNIGNQMLAISQFSAPMDFPTASDAAQCAVGNLTAGNACDLSFVFSPQAPGFLIEDALLTDNALNVANAEQAVVMTGNGISATMVATTTTVSVNPTTAIYGTPVILTANVSTAGGPVTNGSVVFSINGVEVAGASLNGSGVATVTRAAAPTGTDVVTASFAAQGNYDASSSNQATLIVSPAMSQVTLSASTQQIRLGQNVIFTANVTSASGIPTGDVIFLNGSAQIGEAIVNATGQAILNTQNLPAGTDTITAEYLGDANFGTSTSNSVTVTVADDTLTMTVTPPQMSIPAGQTGQVAVTLTPKNGFAGTVNLSCAGLIQGATCQFSSATATFAAQTQTPQTFTLTINPNTVATSGVGFPTGGGGAMMRLVLLLLTLAAAFLVFQARKQSGLLRLGRVLLIVFCLGLGLTTLSGCKNLAPTMPVSDPINVQASMPTTGVIASQQIQVYLGQ